MATCGYCASYPLLGCDPHYTACSLHVTDDSEHVVVAALQSYVFFFQAEDGIRDADVTGVQTCALPISADHLARRFAPERCDGKLLVVRATHPCGLELRPEVQQEKCPRRAGHVGELGEQSLALRIDPVGVVEMNHERTGGAAGPEHPPEQSSTQSLLLDRVSPRPAE